MARDLWVLTRGAGLETEILTTASSPSELEAFSTVHDRVRGAKRPFLLGFGYLMSVGGVIAGSVLGSTAAVVASSFVTVVVVAKFSEYVTGRRVVRRRMPASVR